MTQALRRKVPLAKAGLERWRATERTFVGGSTDSFTDLEPTDLEVADLEIGDLQLLDDEPAHCKPADGERSNRKGAGSESPYGQGSESSRPTRKGGGSRCGVELGHRSGALVEPLRQLGRVLHRVEPEGHLAPVALGPDLHLTRQGTLERIEQVGKGSLMIGVQ